MRKIFLGFAFALATAPVAWAQDAWQATSTTALSITGDIQMTRTGIVFENGKELRLTRTKRPGVLRVAKQANPVLKNGNFLCAQKRPPTFVVYAFDKGLESLDSSSVLYLKVYYGKQLPAAAAVVGMDSTGSGFCALYNYSR